MKKNIAVIGCGYWGKNLVRNFYELKSLYAICDNDEDRLKSFQEKYPNVTLYNDYKSLLKDPEIEAVVISTPAATHYSFAKEALSADKDVFVEKPIALNYKDGEELVSLAREKNKILMVGHLLEYHPAVIKLKDLIDNGELGKIKYIYSNRLNLGKFRTEENILWSFAPHDISVILDLLEEMPKEVSAQGGNYLDPDITDVTITTMNFPSGVKAHIFVSWLHPYKEQKLVVIGGKKMIMFDDVNHKNKLLLYSHKIEWIKRIPVPHPEEAQIIEIEEKEPLKSECEHFIDCISTRKQPKTDGNNGLRVLKILETCQDSLRKNGRTYNFIKETEEKFFVHESSFVDENVEIGEGTKVWHFSHIMKTTKLGKNCNIGQNVVIGPNVTIGNNVKIQNNVSIYNGVTLEDDVFCGPSMVFTNVINPRSHWPRKDEYKKTLVKQGASGIDGEIIYTYKFRTMHPYSEYIHKYILNQYKLNPIGKINNDIRITSWGRRMRKYWIDELPMLINLLQGDLKLVGLRPISKSFFSTYPKNLKKERIKHTPGLFPALYADMPHSIEEIWESERKYIIKHKKHPRRTDFIYFFRIINNILFHKYRSQ